MELEAELLNSASDRKQRDGARAIVVATRCLQYRHVTRRTQYSAYNSRVASQKTHVNHSDQRLELLTARLPCLRICFTQEPSVNVRGYENE